MMCLFYYEICLFYYIIYLFYYILCLFYFSAAYASDCVKAFGGMPPTLRALTRPAFSCSGGLASCLAIPFLTVQVYASSCCF